MKKLFFMSAVCAIFFLFSGCDEIKKLSVVDVDIPNVEFSFPAMEIDATRADMHSFEWTENVSISNLGSKVAGYNISYCKGATCESASVRIYPVNAGVEGKVENLRIEVIGGSSPPAPFTKSEYILGETCSDAALKTFAEKLLFNLLTQEFTLKVSGKTDLPSGELIAAEIAILDIKVKIQLLN